MTQTWLDDIRDFHEKFGLAYDGPPRQIPEELGKFRLRFMQEELCEYAGLSSNSGDIMAWQLCYESEPQSLDHQLDALVDLIYVALGTAYLHGFTKFEEAWRRVHEANMKKIRVNAVDESKRKSQYDVVKPEGWIPPDLADLVT